MKKIYSIFAISLVGILAFASFANASTPNFSVNLNSDGNTVQVNVAGDPNAPVNLYYNKTGSGATLTGIGTTDATGTLTVNVDSATLQIPSGTAVHVVVNNQSSADATWPTLTLTSGTLALSQTSVVTTIGQATVITATNNSSGTLYLSNNSNPQVANISINGNQVTISAIANGTTTTTVCKQGTTNNCASIYVTIQASGSTVLTFSQSSVTIAQGQSVPITIYGGTGYYMVQNNSNQSLIQTSINGSVITLSVNNSTGTGAVTVCSTNNSSCGIINVTAGTTSSSAITFSQQNITLSVAQSTNVYVSGGGSSTYYISNNSNPNILQATISGNTLSLTGNVNGSSSVNVCSSTGSCGIVNVSVNYVSTGGKIALSQTYLNLLIGQTLSVTATGGTAPYNVPISSNSIYSATVSGNVISIYGKANGSGIVDVCSAEGGCIILNVNISGTGTTNQPYFSQNNITIYSGQSSTISISGTGGYYVASNSNSSVATALISGTNIIVSAINAGMANINVCQTGGQCNILYVTVSASTVAGTATTFLTFSNQNPTVSVGQTQNISVYGTSSANYSVVYNSNSNALNPTMSGAVLNLYGRANGPAVVVVCDQINNCGAVSVAVGSVVPGTTTTTTSTPIALSNSSVITTPGQSQNVTISGSGGYYVASNSSSSVATVSISGNAATILGVGVGNTSVSICQSSGQCALLAIIVNSSSVVVVPPVVTNKFVFTRLLGIGDTGNDVLELQKKLKAEGVYTGSITGTFGSLTSAGVKAFQAKYGIRQVGSVGPLTMAQLNK